MDRHPPDTEQQVVVRARWQKVVVTRTLPATRAREFARKLGRLGWSVTIGPRGATTHGNPHTGPAA